MFRVFFILEGWVVVFSVCVSVAWFPPLVIYPPLPKKKNYAITASMQLYVCACKWVGFGHFFVVGLGLFLLILSIVWLGLVSSAISHLRFYQT